MNRHVLRWAAALGVALAAAGMVAACGSATSTRSGVSGAGGAGVSGTGGVAGTGGGGGSTFVGSGGAQQGFEVTPSGLQTIPVIVGQTMPAVKYTATLGGSPVSVAWSVDQGAIGSIPAGPSSTAAFAPTGTTGGMVNVLAALGSQTLKRQIMVKLSGSQNGPNPSSPGEQAQIPSTVAQLSAGGGVGGVGGEGLGPEVVDTPTLNALAMPASNGQAQMLSLLYPYDKTVWPRGMLAPLLMWSWTTGDADAIQIKLQTTTGSFSWTGIFGRPAILALTGGDYIRSPIPQDIWAIATNTASGPADQITVSLTVAKDGVGYGPISETWTVAPALLSGTVYYNSYATQLVKNWGANRDAAGNPIGAAILGVKSGDLGPTLVVGANSATNDSGCRVCHVVSSKGRWLITQSEAGTPTEGQSYLYDLTAADVPDSGVALPQQGTFAWAAMTGDGAYALSNAIDPSSTNAAITNSAAGTAVSSFWQFGAAPATAPLAGLPAGVAAGYPSYAPDDTLVAYVNVTGNTNDVHGPIVVANYDATTQAFSNVRTVALPGAGQRIGYPVFLPDDSGLLFETQLRSGGTPWNDTVMVTRNGARSELWWVTLGASQQAVPLATLNGKGYLPIGANDHGSDFDAPDPVYTPGADESMYDDTTLNYEPTVLPIVSGGYAWVVFTSRRLYGNQLTTVPWLSWPADYDTTDLATATVKKLWVAAIDLNAPPGTDPSHPAFYLPAQEILAGNSRGFWVLDPCQADGTSCQTGDQCCNGYCNGPSNALVCASTAGTTCSGLQEKCATAANCCDSTNLCINGFCALATPQ